MQSKSCFLVASLLLCAAGAVNADSWRPARPESYVSASKAVRLAVSPRELAGALPYFQDKVDGKEPAGQRVGSAQKEAHGLLERKGGKGRWMKVWSGPLRHEVAPNNALVANSGRRFITFDNWHSQGYGDNVVVLYDDTGRVIRSLGLEDFLPKHYVTALPRSVSSIWWSGEHRIDERRGLLVMQVVVPALEDRESKPAYVEVRMDLETGTVLQPTGPAWERALGAAVKVNAAR